MMRGPGGTGPRTRGLPRVRPETEHNIIQNPEILRRMQQGLGMRQAHVAPVLGEGLQPVVIVEDLTRARDQEAIRWVMSAQLTTTSDTVNAYRSTADFLNPIGSGVRLRIKWFMMEGIGITAAGNGPLVGVMFYTEPYDGARGGPITSGGITYLDGGLNAYFAINGANNIDQVATGKQTQWPKHQGPPRGILRCGKESSANFIGNLYDFSITDNDVNSAGTGWAATAQNRVDFPDGCGPVLYPGQSIVWQHGVAVPYGAWRHTLVWSEEPLT